MDGWQTLSPVRAGVVIFALAVCVQAAFLFVLPEPMQRSESSDYQTFYEPVARTLLADGVLQTPDGGAAVRYPPGFPVGLAWIFALAEHLPGDEALWLLLAGLFIGSLGATAHHQLCRHLVGARGAFVASLMLLSYLPWLWLHKQPNSETLFLPLLFAGLAGFAGLDVTRPRAWNRAAVSGALLALATLVRPVSLLLPVGLAGLLVFGFVGPSGKTSTGRRLGVAAVLLATFVAVLAPWQIWVRAQVGDWIPISTGGRLSLLDGLTVAAKDDRDGPEVPADVRRLMEAVQGNRSLIGGPADAAQFMVEEASLLTVAKTLWVKATRSWYATESLRYEKALAALQAPYLIAVFFGLIGLFRAGPGARSAFWIVLAVSLYFWAMTILVLSILRYMVPAMALLFAAAAFPWTRSRQNP